MDGFHKRTYPGVGAFFGDIKFVLGHVGKLREIGRKNLLDKAFTERLMLAVTQVNDCRYCAYGHARMALDAGVPQNEIDAIMQGSFGTCPPEEQTALLYAQHWADKDGHPDPAARDRLVAAYGAERADAIDLMLRMIRMGNYTGNSFDYLLWRVSLGRIGDTGRSPQPGKR